MKVYLAGPMSGLPDFNFPAFHAAAARIRARGHDCINPAEVNSDTSLSWRDCMRKDIPELLNCDAVAVLPGWKASRGARLEVQIAHQLGMPVLDAETWLIINVGKPLAIHELLQPPSQAEPLRGPS